MGSKRHSNPRTIRFWALHPESIDWVRLSLRDGDRLTLGGRRIQTDEGWSMNAETFSRDGETITSSLISDGRDCDGRLSSGSECHWTYGGPMQRPSIDGDPITPRWIASGKGWQRDEYAEAAGY